MPWGLGKGGNFTSKCSKLMIAKVGNIFGYRLTDSTGRPIGKPLAKKWSVALKNEI